MLKEIDVHRLQTGMYVILPLSWIKHDFLRTHFQISSEEQIDKIKKIGLTRVTIDTDKGADENKQYQDTLSPTVADKNAAQIDCEDLLAAIRDNSSPARIKARIIHEQSRIVMKKFLENPSAGNIRKMKQGIAEVVNLIMNDDDTTQYLVQITSHDNYTYTHSVTVGVLAIALSKVLLKESGVHNMHELGAGFFLHDLGKVKINNQILNKPAALTKQEMQQIKKHPVLGFKLLFEAGQLSEESKLIVLQHHERMDGTGYPQQLKNEQIHIYGRICSLADVYDALTSKRPYRDAMTSFAALKLMKDSMSGYFQPELFGKFVMMLH